MTTAEIRRLRKKHLKPLSLSCCKYHSHSADCLKGPEGSLAVVKLADELLYLRSRVRDFAKELA